MSASVRCVAVTGAAGFIGGRIADMLRQRGVEVLAYARKGSRPGVSPLRLDDKAAVDRALADCSALVHCAFDFHDLGANLSIMRVLGPVCAARGIRLVLISSAAVYEPFPAGTFDETTPSEIVGVPYSDMKIEIEREVAHQSRTLGLDVIIVQPTLVYGPFCRQWSDTPARELLTGRVVLPNGGEGICNAVYVDDVCSAAIAAMSANVRSGERFIVSGPHVVTWYHFFSAVREALGTGTISCMAFDAPATRAPASREMHGATVLRRAAARLMGPRARAKLKYAIRKIRAGGGEIVHMPDGARMALYSSCGVASTAKARRMLGWEPSVSFGQGMEQTTRYLRSAFASEIAGARRRSGDLGISRTAPGQTPVLHPEG